MATYKVTWFFEGVQQGTTTSSANVGWTETWYYDQATGGIDSVLQQARNVTPLTYLGKRLAFMDDIYRCVWVRASQVDNPRLTKTAGLAGLTRGGWIHYAPGVGFANAAQITCACLVDFYASPIENGDASHHRRFLIRALPSAMINGNVIDEGTEAFRRFLEFCNFLGRGRAPVGPPNAGNPLGIYLLRARNKATNIEVPVNGLVIQDNQRVIEVLTALVPPLVGTTVNLRGVGFPRGVNRVWTVLGTDVIGGVTKLTLGRSRIRLAGDWDGTGFVRRAQYQYRAPEQYTVIGLRTKKIGRPFRLTRGRARAR